MMIKASGKRKENNKKKVYSQLSPFMIFRKKIIKHRKPVRIISGTVIPIYLSR